MQVCVCVCVRTRECVCFACMYVCVRVHVCIHPYGWVFFSFSCFCFEHFIIPCRTFGWPYLGKAEAATKSSATDSCQCVHSIFVCPNKRMSASVWNCQQCAQVLMHATAHGSCRNTMRESALEADSGRNIPCRTRESNPCQYYAWHFGLTLYQLTVN